MTNEKMWQCMLCCERWLSSKQSEQENSYVAWPTSHSCSPLKLATNIVCRYLQNTTNSTNQHNRHKPFSLMKILQQWLHLLYFVFVLNIICMYKILTLIPWFYSRQPLTDIRLIKKCLHKFLYCLCFRSLNIMRQSSI